MQKIIVFIQLLGMTLINFSLHSMQPPKTVDEGLSLHELTRKEEIRVTESEPLITIKTYALHLSNKNLGDINKIDELEVTDPSGRRARQNKISNINLTNNKLTTIPPEITKLNHFLKVLHLGNNQIKTFPLALCDLTSLCFLDLSDNELTNLPSEIERLAKLSELILKNNRLTTVPDTISKLTDLSRLNLSNNRLTSLPNGIGNLKALNVALFSNNQLKELPTEIGNLRRLLALDLSYNDLTSLPPQIGNIKHIVFLDLSDNKLESLPDELGNVDIGKFTLVHNENSKLGEIEDVTKGKPRLEALLKKLNQNGGLLYIKELILQRPNEPQRKLPRELRKELYRFLKYKPQV